MRTFTSPGWYGLRVNRRIYLVLRDRARHPLLFSERNGYSGRRVLRLGTWEAWIKR